MVEFEDGELVEEGYVMINEEKHYITPPTYSGKTPINAENLNRMQRDMNLVITEFIRSTRHEFSATGTFYPIEFESENDLATSESKSIDLNSEDGKIHITGDIKLVELSGVIQQRSNSDGAYFTVRLYKNGVQVSSGGYYNHGTWGTQAIKTDIVQVEDGDVLHYEVSVTNTNLTLNYMDINVKEIR